MAMTLKEQASGSDAVDRRARQIGRDLFDRIGRGSTFLHKNWWEDRMLTWTLDAPEVKVQLFRFVDALPTLRESHSVRRHLDEYLDETHEAVPPALKLPLGLVPRGAWGDRVLASLARSTASQMARRFIAGSTPSEAFQTVLKLRRRRLAFTADLLGEAVVTDSEAEAYQQTCLELLRGLADPLSQEPEIRQIDRDDKGPIPRVNLSLKLTSLTPRFEPSAVEATSRRVLQRLRPILRTAQEVGAFVNVDMEQYAYKDLTYQIFRTVLDEPEFRDWPHAGIVCQAYLREAEQDLRELADWVQRRGTPITVRLVKGAYWDYEVLHAGQIGWPVPVFTQKWQSDASFERCARILLENYERLRPAFGSHNIRSLARAIADAEAMGVPQAAIEIQTLHGMGDLIQRAVVERGLRTRVYTPYGAMLPGMAYLVRRLLENTSNESFLKASSVEHIPIDELLRNPEEVGAMHRQSRTQPKPDGFARTNGALPPFRNEPPTDFNKTEPRARMQSALEQARERFRKGPLTVLPVIGGKEIRLDDGFEAIDPGDTSRVLAFVGTARPEHAEQAIQAARAAFAEWSATPAEERAAVLVRAAQIMRRRRFDLAAIEAFECGKPWKEADADVAEAIDFCEFYARRMIDLANPHQRDVPGETNRTIRFPRGVAVVIPPWNFPLAIPTGMTVAALVTGNTVVLKPAEQSTVVAFHLFEVLREAGLPPGVLNFLPGIGEEIGPGLVEHPEVNLIAFTGSRPVGLDINRRAADTKPGQDHVKRVIAEMGGKNAIIIDDDADLDEAVLGILTSAFGYSGQKCSACSRVIVLDGVYEAFLARLTDAVHALPVGPADDPDTAVPPVISAEARERILEYQRIAESEGRIVAKVAVEELADRGHYVGPLIVADVPPNARIAQEEVFGPLLAVLRAGDLDEAIAIANGTEYALTGGLYSRSPAHIEEVKRRFVVGNLYINRPISGALVDRQPFGGFKLSGIGTKAGGPDYLLEFLLSRTITENTMRRGFAPDVEAIAAAQGSEA